MNWNDEMRLSRRRVLSRAGAVVGTSVLAGCFSDGNGEGDPTPTPEPTDDESDPFPPFLQVEDPPDAVYLPTHREAMVMGETVLAGEYAVSPMFSYPHPFWIVTGERVELVEPRAEDDLHLMVTVWDPETGHVLPIDTGLSATVERDEQVVDQRAPWPMISQGMGFHFGDNVALEGDGTYEMSVRVGPLEVRRTGAFVDRFSEPATATFEFEFDDEFRHEVVGRIEWLDEEEWGTPGAIPPMAHGHADDHSHDDGHDHSHGDDHSRDDEHDHSDDDHSHDDGHDHSDDGHGGQQELPAHPPYSAQPVPDALPGTLLGTPESGDAVFATTLVKPGSRFAGEDEHYLLVSPRTPYNASVLPAMHLTGTINRDEEPTFDGDLVPTINDEAGFHHGVPVDDVQAGDVLTIRVETPPQVARHQGYETAFLSMSEIELPIDEVDDT